MSVYPNLSHELKTRHISVNELAATIGLTRSAFYRRLNGVVDWKLTEVVAICQYLENFDITTLFLR